MKKFKEEKERNLSSESTSPFEMFNTPPKLNGATSENDSAKGTF